MPLKVNSIQCTYIQFNSSGRPDREYEIAGSRAAIMALPGIFEEEPKDILEWLKPQLESLKLRDQFKWKMTEQESRRLSALVFKKKR